MTVIREEVQAIREQCEGIIPDPFLEPLLAVVRESVIDDVSGSSWRQTRSVEGWPEGALGGALYHALWTMFERVNQDRHLSTAVLAIGAALPRPDFDSASTRIVLAFLETRKANESNRD